MRQSTLLLALGGLLLAVPMMIVSAQVPQNPELPGGGGPVGTGTRGTMLAEIDDFVNKMLAFDKNKDGKLAKSEITDDRLLGTFDRADLDKDGYVVKEELTLLAEKEYVPGRGFGGPGGGPGGPGGFGGPGGPGGPPSRPGEILSAPIQQRLGLSDEQKAKVAELQVEVDAKLAKILKADQMAQLKQMRERGPGGPGGGGPGGPRRGGPGGGGPGGPPPRD